MRHPWQVNNPAPVPGTRVFHPVNPIQRIFRISAASGSFPGLAGLCLCSLKQRLPPILVLALLQACASNSGSKLPTDAIGASNTITVVGVVKPASKGAALNQLQWTSEIEESLRSQSRYRFIAYRHAQRSLGKFHQNLLADYQDDEFISRENIDLLAGSGFPSRYLLFATIDGPDDPAKRVYKQNSRNAAGEVVGDRTSVTYSSSRDHSLTGAVFDIYTGDRVWHRTLATQPVASRTFTEYHGSSFAGSVAAMFANRFVNGSEKNRYPLPPPNAVSMRELVGEMVYRMFNGPDQI